MRSRLSEWENCHAGVRSFWELSGTRCGDPVGDGLRASVNERIRRCLAKAQTECAALTSEAAVRERAERIRGWFWEAVGGRPESIPTETVKTGEIACDGYTVEKYIISPRRGAYIPANLYVPEKREVKNPAVLVCPGHTDEGKAFGQYQNVCQTLAENGFTALIFDPIGQGERSEYPDDDGRTVFHGCSGEHDHLDLQCRPLGWSLARFFAHDVESLIDWLRARPDVDPDRVAVTGNSGGGTMTYMAILTSFDKIAAAAPCSFTTSEDAMLRLGLDKDNEHHWFGLTAHGVDYADMLLSLCGKPLLVLLNRHDFCPLDGSMETCGAIRPFWEMLGAGDRLAVAVSETGHEYAASLADAFAAFLAKHFRGETAAKPGTFRCRSAAELSVTKTGCVSREMPGYIPVRDLLAERMLELRELRKTVTPEQRRQYLLDRALGGRKLAPICPRMTGEGSVDNIWYAKVLWQSVDGLYNTGILFDGAEQGSRAGTVVALWNGGTEALPMHARFIRRKIKAGFRVLVPDLTGIGNAKPDPIGGTSYDVGWGTKYRLVGDLTMLGDSLPALRLGEALRIPEMLAALDGKKPDDAPILFFGEGEMAPLASMAAELTGAAAELTGETVSLEEIVTDPYYDNTYWETWLWHGILLVTDIV